MLIDTSISIALRSIYGSYDIKEFSIFDLLNLKEIAEGLKINTNKNKDVTLSIKCPLCGKYHEYNYSFLELINKQVIIAGCEELGIPVLFIGKSFKVEERINRYKQINTKILAMI
ncbi:MAG: hypothetical protein H7Y18_10775 [Clostridiaceae bacterium]|nr:hypothetical protein [Clostridiaceae bacterium]